MGPLLSHLSVSKAKPRESMGVWGVYGESKGSRRVYGSLGSLGESRESRGV